MDPPRRGDDPRRDPAQERARQPPRTSGRDMTLLIETVRVKGGKVPLWPYHLVRLARSARALGVPVPTLVAPAGGPDRVLRYAVRTEGFSLVERAVGSTSPVKLGVAKG